VFECVTCVRRLYISNLTVRYNAHGFNQIQAERDQKNNAVLRAEVMNRALQTQVCMFVCALQTQVCMFVCLFRYVYIYVCASLHVYLCMFDVLNCDLQRHGCLCVYIHTCLYVCIYIFMYMHVCACIYIYTHILYICINL